MSRPLPYIDVFTDFPKILRSRIRDLKTTYNTFRGCCGHLFDNLSANSCIPLAGDMQHILSQPPVLDLVFFIQSLA